MKILAILCIIVYAMFSLSKINNNDIHPPVAEFLWQFETGGCISVSPAVAEDMVFVGACNGLFFGINRLTGTVKWQYDIKKDADQTGFHGRCLLTGDLVIVATDGWEDGFVYAFEQTSGIVRWKHQTGSPVPSDVIQKGNLIYVITQSDSLIALELTTGSIRWSFAPPENPRFDKFVSSPIVSDDLVVMSGRDGIVYALYGDNGRVAWQYQVGTNSSTPVLIGDMIYVGQISKNIVIALSADNGTKLAQAHLNGFLNSYMPPLATNLGLAIAIDSMIVFWKSDLSQPQWQVKTPASISRSPILWNDKVIGGTVNGHVLGYYVSDGNQALSFQLTGVVAGITGYGDILYVGTQEGTLYAFQP
jgi:outer membrane protein assembly factor BamB